jgi:hypothetical protein
VIEAPVVPSEDLRNPPEGLVEGELWLALTLPDDKDTRRCEKVGVSGPGPHELVELTELVDKVLGLVLGDDCGEVPATAIAQYRNCLQNVFFESQL